MLSKKLPLTGIRVLDLSRVLAGPHASQVLADMGADVIKVEHPVRGDDTRSWGPPFAKGGESAYYLCANRNKRSIGIDLQTPRGQQLLRQLAAKSDVLIENMLPGKLAKYGLDYASLSEMNKRLVYASITGYGQTGPWANRPGYDIMVEAEFGLMHITGHADSPPAKVGVAVTDITTGLYTVTSVLAALRYADTTGEGQHLDISLSDCQVASLANIASNVLVSGKRDTGRHGDAHPSICPYQSFPTADGRIMLGCGNDKLFGLFADAIGRSNWKTNPRFRTNADRVANRDLLVSSIANMTVLKPTQHWIDQWSNRGFPVAPINDIKDSLEHPQTQARDMIVEVPHPLSGEVKLVNHPVKWSKTQPGVRTAPPTLGQHTHEILTAEFGLDDAAIESLVSDGIVCGGPGKGPAGPSAQ